MNQKKQDRANVENQAMRRALALMGFDVETVIRIISDNSNTPWITRTLQGVSVRFDIDTARAKGFSDNEIGSLKAILHGLRNQESSHV